MPGSTALETHCSHLTPRDTALVCAKRHPEKWPLMVPVLGKKRPLQQHQPTLSRSAEHGKWQNISFYEPLIAWHCLSKYCNACSWVPNKTPCDLTVARSESAGSMSGQILMSWGAQEWTQKQTHDSQYFDSWSCWGLWGSNQAGHLLHLTRVKSCVLHLRLLQASAWCRSLCSLLFVLFFSWMMQFGC